MYWCTDVLLRRQSELIVYICMYCALQIILSQFITFSSNTFCVTACQRARMCTWAAEIKCGVAKTLPSHGHAKPTSATWWLTLPKTYACVPLSDTPFKKDQKYNRVRPTRNNAPLDADTQICLQNGPTACNRYHCKRAKGTPFPPKEAVSPNLPSSYQRTQPDTPGAPPTVLLSSPQGKRKDKVLCSDSAVQNVRNV